MRWKFLGGGSRIRVYFGNFYMAAYTDTGQGRGGGPRMPHTLTTVNLV